MTNQPIEAITVAKERASRESEPEIKTLKSGVRVRIVPVSATLIDEVVSNVKDPQIPVWHNPDKDRDELNENDPNYLKELEVASKRRGVAAMDAMIMFGVELVDGIPEDDKWRKKLELLNKKGSIKLDDYDLKDEIDLEFVYKRYILADSQLLSLVSSASGMGEEVAKAEKSFPGD